MPDSVLAGPAISAPIGLLLIDSAWRLVAESVSVLMGRLRLGDAVPFGQEIVEEDGATAKGSGVFFGRRILHVASALGRKRLPTPSREAQHGRQPESQVLMLR